MRQIFFVLLLLSACQYLPQTTQPYELPEIYKGTDGITIELLSHPAELYPNQLVDLIFLIRNKGAYNVDKAYSKIVPERQYLAIQETERYAGNGSELPTAFFPIQGRSRQNPYGEQVRAHYRLRARTLPAQMQSYRTQLYYELCYPYKTYATIPVCIDPDILNTNPDKPCRPGTETLSGGQGAPIAITSIETIMAPSGIGVLPIFSIEIANQGDGQVLAPGSTLNCSIGEKTTLDQIRAKITLEGEDLYCNGKNSTEPIELVQGRTTLKCQHNPLTGRRRPNNGERRVYTMQDATYNTPLQIELTYDYITTKSTTITIERF